MGGTGGKTLRDLGYGFLGQYRRHVKDHINRLLDLGHHTCIADPLEPGLPEVATALAALTGEPHPLAIKDPGTGPAGEYRH